MCQGQDNRVTSPVAAQCGSVDATHTYLGVQMTKLKLSAAIAVLAVPLLLGGCSGDTYGVAALESAAGPADEVPADVDLSFPEGINEATLRLLAEDKGRQYFGARSEDGAQACLAVVPLDRQVGWYAGCGATTSSANRILTVGGPDGSSATLVRDNADTERLKSEGFRSIHKNVYVAR